MIKELLNERNLPEIPADRNEIKEILQREMYGYMPGNPENVHFEEVSKIEGRFPCRAEIKQMKCTFTYNGKQGEFPFSPRSITVFSTVRCSSLLFSIFFLTL